MPANRFNGFTDYGVGIGLRIPHYQPTVRLIALPRRGAAMSGTLLELQRRMASAVMEPLTRLETMRKVRRDGVGMEREAAAFIKPNASLSSLERLEIYNRQYWFRLYSSFEDDFPGLLAVLGRKRFERVMRAYLDARPSTSYTLRDLGSRLHSFLLEREELTAPVSRLAQDVVRLE